MNPVQASAAGPTREALAPVELARPERDALKIDDHAVWDMIAMVRSMDVIERLTEWELKARKGPGGAPKSFPTEALLVAMALSVRYNQGLTLTRFMKVMFKFISPKMRVTLGIPDPPAEDDLAAWKLCYRNVRTRFHAMVELMDPSPYPKNKRLTPDEFAAATKTMTPHEITVREERLLWFCNQIIGVSFQAMPRHIRRRWTGSVGLDATPIPAFARAERKAKRRGPVVMHSADPDAAWYIREGDHRDLDAMPDTSGDVIKKLKKQKWAYELTVATAGPADPSEENTFPYLVTAMAPLHKPGVAPGDAAIKALRNAVGRGLPAGRIGCDRLYTGLKPESFRLPAQALGFDLVIDYKDNQLGLQGSWEGANEVDGGWYCPSMPEVLVTATADHRAGLIDEALWQQRIEKRRSYAFRAKAKPDAEGFVRLMCPAAGAAPTATCPHKKSSTSRHMLGKTPILLTVDLQHDPPAVCTQQTVTFPPEAGDRYLQPLPHATPEWQRTYAILRNIIEGLNGIVKDGSYEALADSTKRRVRGTAAQSILVAFGLFAANLRKIDSFMDLAVVEPDGRLRKPRKRRRKEKPVQDFAPTAASGDPPNTA